MTTRQGRGGAAARRAPGAGSAVTGYTHHGGRTAIASYRRAAKQGEMSGLTGIEAMKERGAVQSERLLALERTVQERKKRNKLGQQKGRWVQEAMALKASRKDAENDLRKLLASPNLPDSLQRELDNDDAVRLADQRGLYETVQAVKASLMQAAVVAATTGDSAHLDPHRGTCRELHAAVGRELARLDEEQRELEAALAAPSCSSAELTSPSLPSPTPCTPPASAAAPLPAPPPSCSGTVMSSAPSVSSSTRTSGPSPEVLEVQGLTLIDATVRKLRDAGTPIDEGLVACYREAVAQHAGRLRHALEDIEHTVVSNHFRPRGYRGLAQPSTYARSAAPSAAPSIAATPSVKSVKGGVPVAQKPVGGRRATGATKVKGKITRNPVLPAAMRDEPPSPRRLVMNSESPMNASAVNSDAAVFAAPSADGKDGEKAEEVPGAALEVQALSQYDELPFDEPEASDDLLTGDAVGAAPSGAVGGAEEEGDGVEEPADDLCRGAAGSMGDIGDDKTGGAPPAHRSSDARRESAFAWMASLPGMTSLKTLVLSTEPPAEAPRAEAAAHVAPPPKFADRLRRASAASRENSEMDGESPRVTLEHPCLPAATLSNRPTPRPMNVDDLNRTASTVPDESYQRQDTEPQASPEPQSPEQYDPHVAGEPKFPARLRRESHASRECSRANTPSPTGALAEDEASIPATPYAGSDAGGSVAVATLLTSVDADVARKLEHIMKGFRATGGTGSREALTDRVQLQFPDWSKKRVQDEVWKYERGRHLARRVGVVCTDARKGMQGLLGTLENALVQAAELRRAEAAHGEYLEKERRKQDALKQRVATLRAAKADAEAVRVQAELEEAEGAALVHEAEECIRSKEYEDRLRALAEHRLVRAEQAEAEAQRQHELDLANATAAAKQAAFNHERVSFRAESFQAKQDRLREDHELAEYEKVMQQDVLNSIAASVAPQVERDPSRPLRATVASSSTANPQLINEQTNVPLHGFSSAAITKDKRYRLIQALGDAGLLQTDYARNRISAAAPVQKGLAAHKDNPLRIAQTAGNFPMPTA